MEVAFLSTYNINFVLIFGTIIFVIAYFKLKSNSCKNLPPGPRGLEALRGILQGIGSDSLSKQAETWSHQYGKLVLCRSILGDICLVNSARLARELYASKELEQFTNNRPRTFVGWFVGFNYRDVICGSPDIRPEWPKMRKLFHQAIKFYGDGTDRIVNAVQTELNPLITEIEESKGQDIDVHEILSTSFLRVIIVLLMGESPEPSLVDSAKQFDKIANRMLGATISSMLTPLPCLRFVPFLPYRKLCLDVIKLRDRTLDRTFTKAKATFNSCELRGILDVFLNEQEKEDGRWLTDDHIRGLVLDTIAAGHVTSTQTLKCIFLYLIHNPHVMHKIQEEIENQLGERTPQLQDKINFPYTEATILETLRMVSLVTLGLPHVISKEVTLDGYTLPKGTTVLANAQVFHKDPEIFPDADVFRPERFLDNKGQLIPANHPVRQSILPFGIGKRGCPGESFARSRIFLYVTTLLQKFDILPPGKHKLLSTERSSFEDGAVIHLKRYHAIYRVRSEAS